MEPTITLKHGHELIRSGPYRIVRHPIYTGFTSAALGTAITATTGDALVGFALLLASCLVKIRREERFLTAEFGDTYRRFQAEIPMLVPFLR